MALFQITASYVFLTLEEATLPTLRAELVAFGHEHDLRGLVLVASEGLNGTVAGSAETIAKWKTYLTTRFGEIVFKDSTSDAQVFRRWSVKIKEEIVGIKNTALRPAGKHHHLTPQDWQKMLEQEDVVVIDTRNAYEVAIGKFTKAIDPGLTTFSEFPEWVKKGEIPKGKKVMMYCTGGIRCEKALLAMEAEGYENVYQLEGGILAYLAQFPHRDFAGECFVFDKRVAVDQQLQPSETYGTCPHCGNPGSLMITCACGKNQKVCTGCAHEEAGETCSKRCRNDVRRAALMR